MDGNEKWWISTVFTVVEYVHSTPVITIDVHEEICLTLS